MKLCQYLLFSIIGLSSAYGLTNINLLTYPVSCDDIKTLAQDINKSGIAPSAVTIKIADITSSGTVSQKKCGKGCYDACLREGYAGTIIPLMNAYRPINAAIIPNTIPKAKAKAAADAQAIKSCLQADAFSQAPFIFMDYETIQADNNLPVSVEAKAYYSAFSAATQKKLVVDLNYHRLNSLLSNFNSSDNSYMTVNYSAYQALKVNPDTKKQMSAFFKSGINYYIGLDITQSCSSLLAIINQLNQLSQSTVISSLNFQGVTLYKIDNSKPTPAPDTVALIQQFLDGEPKLHCNSKLLQDKTVSNNAPKQ